jgi:hypothetical protein
MGSSTRHAAKHCYKIRVTTILYISTDDTAPPSPAEVRMQVLQQLAYGTLQQFDIEAEIHGEDAHF